MPPKRGSAIRGHFSATFSLASNTVRNSAEGPVKKTEWYRVIAFGKQAETLARYVRKGSRLCVQGRLTFTPWLDRKGAPQVSADVVLQEFRFVSDGRREIAENGKSAAETPENVVETGIPADIKEMAA